MWEAYLENFSWAKTFPTVVAVAGGILVGNLMIGLGDQRSIEAVGPKNSFQPGF
jgi:hypothetical protein